MQKITDSHSIKFILTIHFSSIKLADEFVSFDSLSEMLDTYYADKAERDRVKQVAASVIQKNSK